MLKSKELHNENPFSFLNQLLGEDNDVIEVKEASKVTQGSGGRNSENTSRYQEP